MPISAVSFHTKDFHGLAQITFSSKESFPRRVGSTSGSFKSEQAA
jgi:hypothetical protein